ncbi:uncharacterized protein [Rhodnius prolixus]|uniref:uncharacterized protein n=1 Tax=Rhodnius prolixus TaxID=13249 RepID=UPI003D18A231
MHLLVEFENQVIEFIPKSDTTFGTLIKKICKKLALRPQSYCLGKKDNIRFENGATITESGLSNGDRIYLFEKELVNLKKKVSVTIQFNDYSAGGLFKITDTLLAVLKTLASDKIIDKEGVEPSLHFTEVKFSGYDQLSTTKLTDLGVLEGEKISMKFFYRYISPKMKTQDSDESTDSQSVPKSDRDRSETEEGESEIQRNIFSNRKRFVICYTQLEDYPYIAPKRSLLFKLPGKLNRRHQVLRSFFHISCIEIGMLLKEFEKVGLGNEGKLLTSKTRNRLRRQAFLIEEDLLDEKVTALRICFYGGYILQSIFKPTDTIYDVKQLIKSLLKKENGSFFLYKLRPFQIFHNPKMSLADGGLVPTSEIYFGPEYKAHKNRFIKTDFIQNSLVTHCVACKVAMMLRIFPNDDLHAASNAYSRAKNKAKNDTTSEFGESMNYQGSPMEEDFVERMKNKFKESEEKDSEIEESLTSERDQKVEEIIGENEIIRDDLIDKDESGDKLTFSETDSDGFSDITSSTESI